MGETGSGTQSKVWRELWLFFLINVVLRASRDQLVIITTFLSLRLNEGRCIYLPIIFPWIHSQDLFSLSKCKSALPMAAMRKAGVPLPPSSIELLEENVAWAELKVRIFSSSISQTKTSTFGHSLLSHLSSLF